MTWRRAAKLATSGVVFALGLSGCPTTFGVKDSYMSLDQSGERRRTEFFTDTVSIFCTLEYGSARSNVSIENLVRQTQRYDFEANVYKSADRVLADGDAVSTPGSSETSTIALVQTGANGQSDQTLPYPAGSFQCEIYADGDIVATVPFTIDFPPCPTAIISEGDLCFGFYKTATKCPLYGASSTEPDQCTCNGPTAPNGGSSLTWHCPTAVP